MSLTAMKQDKLKTPYINKIIQVYAIEFPCQKAKRELRNIKKQYRALVTQLERSEKAVDNLMDMVNMRNEKIIKYKEQNKKKGDLNAT